MKATVDLLIYAMPFIIQGIFVTIGVAVAGMLLGLLLGVLLVLLRMTGFLPAKIFVNLYVSFIRGTPFLVQILIVFYSLSALNISLSNTVTGIISVGLNTAAFMSETIRSGFNAIPEGHIEAAKALGMSRKWILIRIQLAQIVEIIKPQMLSEFINGIKVTPLLSTIGVVEITRQASRIVSRRMHPVPVYILVIVIYFIVNSLLERILNSHHSRYADVR
jgi:His/Glu/Gln/Arg/opine family amino acid ABC transporter permease subunit